jgi:predicted RNA binding protein YcfA (HicA-like mRNA interferase family)
MGTPLARTGGGRIPAAKESAMPVKVKDAIKRIEAHGWQLARTRGSHRQYRHPERPGLVTIAGKPSDTLHPKTWASIIRQAGLEDER